MSSDLLSAALSALADAERALLGGGADRHVFHRQGATLWDPADDRIATARLADRAVRANGRTKEDELVIALRSSIVRVGKLAAVDRLKVRSYLVVDGEVRSLKVWSGAAAVKTGGRERDIRARIEGIEGYRTPPILQHGEVGSTAYLLEPVVYGRHPASGHQRVEMVADLGAALTRGYVATTDGDRPLSEVTHPEFGTRLQEVLADERYPWPDDGGDRDALRRRAARLIERDLLLPVAITHGDLVASNIIRDDDARHHLVDWEHGRRGPAAFDLMKLVLTSGDDEAGFEAIRPHLGGLGGRGWRRYRATHQLALGLAQTLSWAPGGRERAERAGRLARYDQEHLQRLRWLIRLLNV